MEVRSVTRIGRWEEWGDSAPRRQREREQKKEGKTGRAVTKMVSELSTGGRSFRE